MPAYNPPKHFPGSNALGGAGQALLERFFPPNELPMGGAVIPPRTPVPIPQGRSLPQAFKPWGKSLDKAYPEMYGPSQVPGPPAAVGEMEGALQKLLNILYNTN